MGGIEMSVFKSRDEWLQNRRNGLGGSDMAAVMGLSPSKDNVQLWREKTGKAEAVDIGRKEYVKYGHAVEPLMRQLFALDHPELMVGYTDNNSWHNTDHPWAVASLDGWLTDNAGQIGILEIKTTTIQRSSDWDKWTGCIPMNYYCQVLFYMGVIEAEYAWLRAHIRYTSHGEPKAQIADYRIDRANPDVENDIEYLMAAGREFWNGHVLTGIPPARILPDI